MNANLITTENGLKPLLDWRLWAPPTVMAGLLVVLAQYSYLAFHTFAELFAIIISFLIFSFAWATRRFSANNFLLFLACGYFWIGGLDLMHTLAYKGMNVFVEGSGNLSVQFWIGTRYFEALLLLVAPFVVTRKPKEYLLMTLFGFFAVGLTALILAGRFPVGFVEGVGLTDFKIFSEYLIIVILALALTTLFRYGRDISVSDKGLIAAAILMTMCAELAFTFYVDVYGLSNLAGHIFKLFSFWLIFEAIVISHLQEPYTTLQDSEHEYRSILNNMVDTFYRVDLEGNLAMISPSAVDIGGYSPEELIGKPLRMHYVVDGMWEKFGERLVAGDGKVVGFQAEISRKDGSRAWVSISAHYWKGADGSILGTEGTIRNITAHKNAEEALRRSQKMEAVGQMTGGIAHDYNNMLGVIVGNIQLVQETANLDGKSKQRLGKALSAAQRNAELTKKMLGFSRTQQSETRLTAVNKFITNLEEIIKTSLTAVIKVDSSLLAGLWLVDIDPAEFEDMMLNLTINARDAMPDGGTLGLKTENKIFGDREVREIPGSRAGEFVMISVSDTGVGIPDEIREQIFDPFFSTKETGKGTGLGLSMVYAFVQRSHGFVKVDSEPGQGTTFRIFLPRAYEKAGRVVAQDEVSEQELPRGIEVILVVDDEDFLIEIAVAFLENLGYRTVTASDGSQALEVLKARPEIDLLFSDVIMPGELDGFALAKAAADLHPGMKVLLTSGFTGKSAEFTGGSVVRSSIDLLKKPYSHGELAVAVRRTLDARDM